MERRKGDDTRKKEKKFPFFLLGEMKGWGSKSPCINHTLKKRKRGDKYIFL